MDNKNENSQKAASKPDLVTIMVSVILLGIGLYFLFFSIDTWAVKAFARPILASSLVAALDVAVFFVALALAPSLSSLVGLVIRR